MPRKSKQKSKKRPLSSRSMPKLGWQDNLLYAVLTVLLFGIALCPLLLPMLLKESLSFRDSRVVAFAGTGDLWGLIPMFFLFLMTLILMAVYWGQRHPIFGRKDVSYGPPRYPSIYPLLWKNKPQIRRGQKETEQDKKETRTTVTVLTVVLVVSLALGALAYCGRETLHRDGTVVTYNPFNREADNRTPEELTAVRVDTYAYKNRRSPRGYSVELNLEFQDGSTCRFVLGNFRGDTLEELQTLLALKERYGPLFQAGDATYLRDVVQDMDLTAEEEELLHRLFDQKQTSLPPQTAADGEKHHSKKSPAGFLYACGSRFLPR